MASGLVSREFYRELSYLYDQRRPEVEHWLNALVRYSLSQPTAPLPDDADDRPEEHGS